MIIALYGLQTPLDFDLGFVHFTANVTFTRWAIFLALLFVTCRSSCERFSRC